LEKIVPTILQQTFGDFEWIIIDDTKTPEDEKRLKDFIDGINDKRIHIIKHTP